ncbi:MAG: DUF977 family protein [Candidatus Pacebacteria bacterium]|nr:DUF977 family protein [Candidatus Paceibacterota bacterium]
MILIYIIIGIIVGYSIFIYINKDKFSKINNLNKKEESILKLINKNGRVTNNDVEKLLDVSDATATRYLQELENKGLVIQEGETGRGVFYKKF